MCAALQTEHSTTLTTLECYVHGTGALARLKAQTPNTTQPSKH